MYGEVGLDITDRGVADELKSANGDDVVLRINSPGGDVWSGRTVMHSLRSYGGHVTAVVEGIAASAASFIAIGGADRVVMRPGTSVMIHDALSFRGGNAAEQRMEADSLDKESDEIAAIYRGKAGGEASEWRARMVEETWYSAEEAVEAGLADAVEDSRQVKEPAPSNDMIRGRVMARFKYTSRDEAPSPTLSAPRGQKEEDGGMSSLSHEDVVNIVREVMNENVTVTSDVEVTYPEGSTVVPTGKVTIEPQGELPPSGLSFAVGEASDGFVAEVDEETGVLTVTAPSGAEPDTEVALTVTVSGNDAPVELPVGVAVKSASSDEEEATEEAPAEEPAPSEAPALDDRVVLDVDTYNDLKAAAQLGWDAKAKADESDRVAKADRWIAEGRVNAAHRAKVVAALHANEDAATELYGSIPKNTIPVAEIGHGKDVDAAQDAAKSDFRARADRLLGTRSNF